MKGKVIIISAPSGAGKTSIIREILNSGLNLEFSVSACSRPKRKGEVNGKDYWFLSPDDFKHKIEKDEFLEWEEVYKDHYYGTLKSEIQRIWDKGKHVLVEADVYGGMNIKSHFPERSLSLFIMPPSIEALKTRLIKRSTDNPENIKTRVEKAKEEISLAKKFDAVVVNDTLSKAIRDTQHAIRSFLQQGD